MKIKEIIEHFKDKDGEEELIIAWWGKEASPCDTEKIPWSIQCQIIEENMDWSGAHEDLGMCVEYNADDFYNDADTEERMDK